MALMKLSCYYCGGEVFRNRKIIAPVCPECKKNKQNESLCQARRELMASDKTGEVKRRVLKEHKKYRDSHDYADRSSNRRPLRSWSESEKILIAERVASDDDLAKRYGVSITAIRAVRFRMNSRQSVLLAEENKREIERRGGVDL